MYCGKCGTMIPEGFSFCGKCGTPVPSTVDNIETENAVVSAPSPVVKANEDQSIGRLIEYLNIAYDHEVICNRQNIMYSYISSHKPELTKAKAPELKEKKSTPELAKEQVKFSFGRMWLGMWFSLIVFVAVICFIINIKYHFTYFYEYVLLTLVANTAISFAIALFCSLVDVVTVPGHNKKVNASNQEIINKYNLECKEIDDWNAKENARYSSQQAELDKIYNRELSSWEKSKNDIGNNLKEAQTNLDNVYDLDILYKDYRNIVAVTLIKKYLESGQAKTLAEAYDRCDAKLDRQAIINGIANLSDVVKQVGADITKSLNGISFQLSQIDASIQDSISTNVRLFEEFKSDYNDQMNKVTANQQATIDSINQVHKDTAEIKKSTEILNSFTNYGHYKVDLSNDLYNRAKY